MVPNHVWAEIPVLPRAIAFLAQLLRQIKDNRHGQDVIVAGKLHQRFPCLRLDIGGIDDDKPPAYQPLGRNKVQDLKGVFGGSLAVLVV